MKVKVILSIGLITYACFAFAQADKQMKTWNPISESQPVIEGQAWPDEVKDFYDRLPGKAQAKVRKEVWNLSKNSAGLQMRFKSNANNIEVKYVVGGRLEMQHMPATGVSGIDLYAKNKNNQWIWSAGKYSFGDTIVYNFSDLQSAESTSREYTLYLPLYNTVKWLEVVVEDSAEFIPLIARNEKPIVVYGTSIAQGGCASRPGLGWTNILGRRLNEPITNLGFSGNGRLESEIIDLMTEIDAKIYVLDCLPNLTSPLISVDELKTKIEESVRTLQSKRPNTPILLTEHDGYTDEAINAVKKESYQRVNRVLKEVFTSLKTKGVQNIYFLSKEEINQDIDSMVDGVHPNDIGMMRYADAYEKSIKTIFKQ